jgi:hypothetical protein
MYSECWLEMLQPPSYHHSSWRMTSLETSNTLKSAQIWFGKTKAHPRFPAKQRRSLFNHFTWSVWPHSAAAKYAEQDQLNNNERTRPMWLNEQHYTSKGLDRACGSSAPKTCSFLLITRMTNQCVSSLEHWSQGIVSSKKHLFNTVPPILYNDDELL